MIVDNTTLQDLSIFHSEEEQSVFNALNYTQTSGGRYWLRHLLSHPYTDLKPILETQEALQIIIRHHDAWPTLVTNGTIMVLEKYFESQVDTLPRNPGVVSTILYRMLHNPDYSLTQYSVGHAIDFLQGLHQMTTLLTGENLPGMLQVVVERMSMLLNKPDAREMIAIADKTRLGAPTKLRFAYFLLYHYKNAVHELIQLHGKLDAYYSLATAVKNKGLHFPSFHHDPDPYIAADGLYHLLLQQPTPYNLEMNHQSNFIFLTGANMAGKSTFIKAVGVAVYLAHIGMAVPAQAFELTLFHGLLSNIQVSDNIIKGESYFYNEVQRIKNTITRINDGKKWLVLIDELFKGTNVQDAMRCSTAVIQGLLKIRNSLFILSTHLYEIGHDLQTYPNIVFRYFETEVHDDQLSFSYQLQNGISNDRLGYLILKREGVVDMLQRL